MTGKTNRKAKPKASDAFGFTDEELAEVKAAAKAHGRTAVEEVKARVLAGAEVAERERCGTSESIQLWVTPEYKAALTRYAADRGRTVSRLVIEAVGAFQLADAAPPQLAEPADPSRLRSPRWLRSGKPVLCVETGEVFETASAASRAVGLRDGSVSEGIRRSEKRGGFTWRHIDPSDERLLPEDRAKPAKRPEHNSRRVECVETGKVYPSASDASRSIGKWPGAVARAAKQGRPCGGFTWRYVEGGKE